MQAPPPYAPAAPAPASAAAAGVGQAPQQNGPGRSSSVAGQQQHQQQQQQQYIAPPLRVAAGAWQQPSQQLLARPVQQVPLLPHLAKPWVTQQTLRFRPQQQQQTPQQQQHSSAGRDQLAEAGYEEYPGWRQSLSLSGKVLPPLSVLFQRALEIEKQLLQQRDVKE